MPFRDGGEVAITGEFHLGKRLVLRTNTVHVEIEARHDAEFRHLEKWAKYRKSEGILERDDFNGPYPGSLGVSFQSALNREETLKVLAPMRESELADLLQLTTRLQELYEASPEFRETNNASLVEWLKEQPEVKRQTLVREVSRLARHFKLTSTKDAVDALSNNPSMP